VYNIVTSDVACFWELEDMRMNGACDHIMQLFPYLGWFGN